MLRNFFVIIVGVTFWGVSSSGSIQKRAAPAALHRYRNHESIPEPDWDGKHHFAGSGFRSATLQRNATYSISNAVPYRYVIKFYFFFMVHCTTGVVPPGAVFFCVEPKPRTPQSYDTKV